MLTFAIEGNPEILRVDITAEALGDYFLIFLSDFETGLFEGSNLLRNYLQRKVRQYRGVQRPRTAAPGFTPALLPGVRPQAPLPASAPIQAGQAGKIVPQGVLDRMGFLGWSV